ncbi:Di-copper centre-containing protein [Colletotrichum caudatum]|nr:Di-copper centre-containing protein [Colletotrichum caudatum]
MKAQAFSAVLIAGTAAVAAVLSSRATKNCENPTKRIEWRQLEIQDQKSYLDSVICLKTKPSRRGLKSTLYDDFGHVHFELNNYIHGGSPFLPWHRYFGKAYESALRDCGYQGPGTYWDWTLDTAGLRHSPVMADELGFGGNGSPDHTEPSPNPQARALQCVNSGPFKGIRPEYLAINPVDMVSGGHCLYRDLPEISEPEAFEAMAKIFGPDGVATTLSSSNWTTFHAALEGGPHGTIHASIGGEMNPTTSPNEPLFFLHHAQIDRIWWMWQQEDKSRLKDYSGKASHFGEEGRREVSFDDVLFMGGIAEDVKVGDVMDTQSEKLCFTY